MSDLIKLSVSRTKTFADCKKKYDYQYNLKLPKKIWDHHILGSCIHKILEEFHLHYLNGGTLKYNEAMKEAYLKGMEEFKDKLKPEMIAEIRSMADQYLRIVYKTKHHHVISCEKPFSMMVREDINVNGAIDRIQIDPDGVYHVGDYKTVRNEKYLVNEFFQLETYAYVVYTEHPEITKVRASYIMLRHGFKHITREIDLATMLKIPGKFIDYAEKITAEKEFPATPTPLCDYCDFQEVCPYDIRKKASSKKKTLSWV